MKIVDFINNPNGSVEMKMEVTDEEHDLLKKLSDEKGLTISQFINQIIEEHVATFDMDDDAEKKD
jgi:predicted DNA-binding protein